MWLIRVRSSAVTIELLAEVERPFERVLSRPDREEAADGCPRRPEVDIARSPVLLDTAGGLGARPRP